MGVDLIACIEHKFTSKELLLLPERLDELNELKALKFSSGDPYNQQAAKSKYAGNQSMTSEILEKIWLEWESKSQHASQYVFDNQINSFIGTIDIWRNTLCIQHFPEHKYSNLEDPEKARIILECNRMMARLTGAGKVVYFTDSAFPTSLLLDKVVEGYKIEEIINYGKKEFGVPPLDLNNAMQFMFYIDDFSQDLSTLKKWSFSEGKFWKYNHEKNGYEKN